MAQKLYTEEEIHRTFGLILNKTFYDGFIGAMKPIELPSDEEIKEYAKSYYEKNKFKSDYPHCPYSFKDGAKWIIKQIINQNK